jgi:hypothetical protein
MQPSATQLLARNAATMMQRLPVHSHHRAPLLQALSKDIPSTAAAPLLGASASYIRDCQRKDYSNADLYTQKYSAGVNRNRLPEATVAGVFSFLVTWCPTPSGSDTLRFKQHISDQQLYQLYVDTQKSE